MCLHSPNFTILQILDLYKKLQRQGNFLLFLTDGSVSSKPLKPSRHSFGIFHFSEKILQMPHGDF